MPPTTPFSCVVVFGILYADVLSRLKRQTKMNTGRGHMGGGVKLCAPNTLLTRPPDAKIFHPNCADTVDMIKRRLQGVTEFAPARSPSFLTTDMPRLKNVDLWTQQQRFALFEPRTVSPRAKRERKNDDQHFEAPGRPNTYKNDRALVKLGVSTTNTLTPPQPFLRRGMISPPAA